MVKLFNGDCLDVMDTLIKDGMRVDVIITDPPYGTTACKNLGRHFIGIELDEKYFNIAKERITNESWYH